MTKRKVYLPKQTISALHDVLQENPSRLQTMLLKYRVPSTRRDIKIYSLLIFFFYILFLILVYYGSYLIKPFAVGPFLLRQRKSALSDPSTEQAGTWHEETGMPSEAFLLHQILSKSRLNQKICTYLPSPADQTRIASSSDLKINDNS